MKLKTCLGGRVPELKSGIPVFPVSLATTECVWFPSFLQTTVLPCDRVIQVGVKLHSEVTL